MKTETINMLLVEKNIGHVSFKEMLYSHCFLHLVNKFIENITTFLFDICLGADKLLTYLYIREYLNYSNNITCYKNIQIKLLLMV